MSLPTPMPSPMSMNRPPHRMSFPMPFLTSFRSASRRVRSAIALSSVAVTAGLMGGGCEIPSFLDPTQMVDPPKSTQLNADGTATPIVQVILDELDLGVEAESGLYPDARDVQQRDLIPDRADYVIGPADVINVRIDDYPFEGQSDVQTKRVLDSGSVNLADVNNVNVADLTEAEAGEAIKRAYIEEGILVEGFARVSVTVIEAQNRTFTIQGRGVSAPSRYIINRADFTMLDAIALGRVVTEAKLIAEYAFVIRRDEPTITSTDAPQNGNNPGNNSGNESGTVQPGQGDPLDPQSRGEPQQQRQEQRDVDDTDAQDDALDTAQSWDSTYALTQGQTPGDAADAAEQGFAFEAPQMPTDIEIIRVPIRELLNGQLRYNIIIRPNDMILIGAEPGGFFYFYGNANVTGSFQIVPGERVTLKRAVASARGLNQVAIPQRTQIVRRYGDQDVFIRVNLAKIFTGQEPDIYMKPDDMVMIGTNLPAPFLAAFRNGFRAAYGFGFLYDRNFARDREGNF